MLNLDTLSPSFTLAAYNDAHRPDVRDLAEMVNLATYNGGAYSTLTDPEDDRTMVFKECVSLYAAKHNITDMELSNALRDWARIDGDAA